MKSQNGDFRKILADVSPSHDGRRIFEGFVRLAACALAAQTREAEYLEEAKQWRKADLGLFAKALGALVLEMNSRPYEDLIGGYYMEFALSPKGRQWNGQFHSPKTVCDLLARMIGGDLGSLPKEGPITVCEPACGAGAMILAFAQACPPEVRRLLRVTAIDISRIACDMAFINTTLWGIPTRVIHGNSLSMECWAAWSNIHYMVPWLPLAFRVQTPKAMAQRKPPKLNEVQPAKASLVHQEFAFSETESTAPP